MKTYLLLLSNTVVLLAFLRRRARLVFSDLIFFILIFFNKVIQKSDCYCVLAQNCTASMLSKPENLMSLHSKQKSLCQLATRPVTRGALGGESPLEHFSPTPGKMCWRSFKTIKHSSKNLGPSQKTLRELLVSQADYRPAGNHRTPPQRDKEQGNSKKMTKAHLVLMLRLGLVPEWRAFRR